MLKQKVIIISVNKQLISGSWNIFTSLFGRCDDPSWLTPHTVAIAGNLDVIRIITHFLNSGSI